MTRELLPKFGSSWLRDLRTWLAGFVNHPASERVIVILIVINAIALGLETSKSVMSVAGTFLQLLDTVILFVFVLEIGARMIVHGGKFWRDPWSVFDFVVVGATLLPLSGNFSILRAIRIIRALRLVSAIPSVRRVVGGLLSAIPSMGAVIVLLLLVNYIFAVMGTKLFSEDFDRHFGTLGASFFTFFQIMTLEGWAEEVVRPVMDKYPMAWLLFIPYIVFVVFAVLNLFIGIIVDAMQREADEMRDAIIEVEDADHATVIAEIRALREEVRALRGELGTSPAIGDDSDKGSA